MSENVIDGFMRQQQQEGNDIMIYPTPTTTMNTSISSSLATNDEDTGPASTTVQQEKQQQKQVEKNEKIMTAQESINNKLGASRKKWKFGYRVSAYFCQLNSRLLKRGNTTITKNNTTRNMHDTDDTVNSKPSSNGCFSFTIPFSLARQKRYKYPQFIWYFRPVGAAFQFSATWHPFEKKNQQDLSRQLHLLSTHQSTAQSTLEIQDKHVFDGCRVMTVMLKEGMAFVLDPEWSMPITYEITYKPKLNWYQEMRLRLEYQKWLKQQQQSVNLMK